MSAPSALADFRRIVVKVGSSFLIDAKAGAANHAWLASLAADLARLHPDGRALLVVFLGRDRARPRRCWAWPGPLKLEDSQAAAAVGADLARAPWSEVLDRHGIRAGQVLVTLRIPRSGAVTSMRAPRSASCLNGAPFR